jgi:hypothetical protein
VLIQPKFLSLTDLLANRLFRPQSQAMSFRMYPRDSSNSFSMSVNEGAGVMTIAYLQGAGLEQIIEEKTGVVEAGVGQFYPTYSSPNSGSRPRLSRRFARTSFTCWTDRAMISSIRSSPYRAAKNMQN